MRILIIVLMSVLLCGFVWGDSCCDKWKSGIRDAGWSKVMNAETYDTPYSAWTNKGIRQQVPIYYCPECGKKLKVNKGV